jgi:hypothetical protein
MACQETRPIRAAFDLLLGRIERAARQSGRDPRDITFVAVSKGVDQKGVNAARQAGINVFGENRVSEAIDKFSDGGLQYPLMALREGQTHRSAPRKDSLMMLRGEASATGASLHLIGSLQTNKVRKAVGFFDLIHSIDSIYLAEKVALEAKRQSIVQPVLVQVNIAQDTTKRGVSLKDAPLLIESVKAASSLHLLGLMTIPPPPVCPEDSRPHYSRLRKLGESLGLNRFSMGMTNDFEVAIAEGATWVRIGTALFGSRALITERGT